MKISRFIKKATRLELYETMLEEQLYGDAIRFFVFFFISAFVSYIIYIVTICVTEVLFTLQVIDIVFIVT